MQFINANLQYRNVYITNENMLYTIENISVVYIRKSRLNVMQLIL